MEWTTALQTQRHLQTTHINTCMCLMLFQNLAKNKRLFTKGDIFTLLVSVVKCDAHVLNMALSTCKIPRQCITIPFDLWIASVHASSMSAAKREQVTKHEHTDLGQHWGRMTFSCPPGEAAPMKENISHAKGEVAQMYTVPKDNLHELVCGREMHDNYGGVSWGLITSIIQACSAGIHTCELT